ncbi:chorismate synthase [Malassezia vespertilionis]|uniref:chorismate synthase n=1 Tax=Malassezia vespertilionis TaxID=2020962 RepID=UPI0024B0485D|nr:chorismate synthase [Malassezia vespertilionis]WFD07644.1 chorismate synthase [Malassezia vespertilionis]
MSTFGTHYRVSTFGESHCAAVGCIVDGIPPGLALVASDIQRQLTRRRPGQSNLTTPRDEKDKVEILSGVEHTVTLGTPVAMMVRNQDQRPHDYTDDTLDAFPRPSHADYTYLEKYGVKASSGGGRSSARETIGRVAAGALAEKYLKDALGVEIVAFVSSVGQVHVPQYPMEHGAEAVELPLSDKYVNLLRTITRDQVDKDDVRCPDAEIAERMRQRILAAKKSDDSIGGTVTCVIRNLPVGLGEPSFDKFEAVLAHAMLSIPATKGFEVGSGFRGTEISGSIHNDPFVRKPDGKLGTKTNWSGGIQGGITNGEDVYFKIAFKPPATISQEQQTTRYDGEAGVLANRGRHDPCVVPRAIPIVEAMAAIAVMDMVLAQDAREKASSALDPAVVGGLPRSMKRHHHPSV